MEQPHPEPHLRGAYVIAAGVVVTYAVDAMSGFVRRVAHWHGPSRVHELAPADGDRATSGPAVWCCTASRRAEAPGPTTLTNRPSGTVAMPKPMRCNKRPESRSDPSGSAADPHALPRCGPSRATGEEVLLRQPRLLRKPQLRTGSLLPERACRNCPRRGREGRCGGRHFPHSWRHSYATSLCGEGWTSISSSASWATPTSPRR